MLDNLLLLCVALSPLLEACTCIHLTVHNLLLSQSNHGTSLLLVTWRHPLALPCFSNPAAYPSTNLLVLPSKYNQNITISYYFHCYTITWWITARASCALYATAMPHFILYNFLILFYFWLHWVFVAAHGLSLVVASRGYSSLWCVGFSSQWLLLLRSTGSRHAGFSSCGAWASVVVVHGISC